LNWTKVLDQVSKIQIKSITDSLFKYGLYIFVLATISALFKTEIWVTIVLFSVGGLFELIGLCFYFYFAKRNPDYLRSESFQLKKQSIEILGDNENKRNPNIKDLVYITNPLANRLGNENSQEKTED
jgi:hypothetical protein